MWGGRELLAYTHFVLFCSRDAFLSESARWVETWYLVKTQTIVYGQFTCTVYIIIIQEPTTTVTQYIPTSIQTFGNNGHSNLYTFLLSEADARLDTKHKPLITQHKKIQKLFKLHYIYNTSIGH